MPTPNPTKSAAATRPYPPRERVAGVDLYLDANEGARRASLMLEPERAAELARSYPDLDALRGTIAARLGRPTDHVVVTAGADDAIDRVMRAYLEPGRTLVVATPTFSMIPRYARIRGADVVELSWIDRWPVDSLLDDPPLSVGVIAMVSPNNPTGRVIDANTVRRVATRFPDAVILLDLAYVEYADENIGALLSDVPNVVQTRTLSKAWGLAGLRVGYAVCQPPIGERLRAVGSPYPVTSWSAAVAVDRLRGGEGAVRAHVDEVRRERDALERLLVSLGARPTTSQANFVFARFENAPRVAAGLRCMGVAVRQFGEGLPDALRIGCPGDPREYSRLENALRSVLEPNAYLFDMDGVIADVTASYREAIRQTAARFGVAVTADDIAAAKRAGNANDDWEVTLRLIEDSGGSATLEEVTECFEGLYQTELWKEEAPLVSRENLEALIDGRPAGIVTGRPRRDALRFLESFDMLELFDVVVTRDDVARLKPDPEGLRRAMDELGAETGWYFGDTVDDARAALAAGLVPVGVLPPDSDELDDQALATAGVMTVVTSITEMQ